jgi:hypothetical protein
VYVSRAFLDANETLLESPALLGFSLSWELDYANVLTLLERAGVPLLASERGEGHALVFGGGPVLTGNPEVRVVHRAHLEFSLSRADNLPVCGCSPRSLMQPSLT